MGREDTGCVVDRSPGFDPWSAHEFPGVHQGGSRRYHRLSSSRIGTMIGQVTIAEINAALRKSEMVSSGKAPNQRVWEGRPSQYRSVGKAAQRAITTPLSQKTRAKIR